MLCTRRAAVAAGRHNGAAAQRRGACFVAARWDVPPPPPPAASRPYPNATQPAATRRRGLPDSPRTHPPPFARVASASATGRGAAAPGAPPPPQPPPNGPPQQEQAAQQAVMFRVHRIGGDGACMFRAVVQGAQVASRCKLMPLESEATAAHNLRLAVVAELRKRREEMEPFLPGIAADFEEYCRTMSHPMAWGGEPEMAMAVHVVGRPITVYHVQGGGLEPIVTYGEQLLVGSGAGAGQAPISLLWSGAHYDLLLPSGPVR